MINNIAEAILDAINKYRYEQQLNNLTLANLVSIQTAQNYACKLVQSSDLTSLLSNTKNGNLGESESLGMDSRSNAKIDLNEYTPNNSKIFYSHFFFIENF